MTQPTIVCRLSLQPQEWHFIRHEVFQKEQGFQNEFDDLDAISLHLCAYCGETAIGCLRLYSKDPQKRHWHLGRLAVLEPYRHNKVASALLQTGKQLLIDSGAWTIALDAQSHLQGFYEHFGYSVCGTPFWDEHVLHIPMQQTLKEVHTC